MRLPSHEVNADSRNPDVLPIFLRFIPKSRRRPSPALPHAEARQTASASARAIASASSAAGARRCGAGRPVRPRRAERRARRTADEPGSAAWYLVDGGAARGRRRGQRARAAHALLRAAGARRTRTSRRFTINTGCRPARPVHVPATAAATTSSRRRQGAAERAGALAARRSGQWGAPTDALPDLPAWAEPGDDVGTRRRAVRHALHAVFHVADSSGVSTATMCIGDAISTAAAGPYIASPDAVHLPAVARRLHRPPRVRRRRRTGLHDVEVGPERAARTPPTPDLQPAPERRRHAARRGSRL